VARLIATGSKWEDMAVDGEQPEHTDEAEMLPDEAAVLPERGEALDDADEDDLLTTEEAAERLGIDLD
jgi:hypothetical protein